MKGVIEFNNGKNIKRKLNKRKIAVLIIIVVVAIIIAITSIAYSSSRTVRKFLDQYLFRKNVSEEKLASIGIEYDSNVTAIAYNKSICILAENTLKQYNTSGKLENEIKLEISNPIYSVNNKYLAISQEKGSNLYLISGSNIAWEAKVDGSISKISVNKNGYVSVILDETTYKSIIITYDSKGNELFKTYLSSTTAIDSTISQDNKYLSFAEINTSGTTIQSNIKIVSIEKAKETPSESIIYTYEAPSNSLVTNIEYHAQSQLVCMYDDSVHLIKEQTDEVIISLQENDHKVNFANIELSNYTYRAIEKATSLFSADTSIEIVNINNKKTTIYTVEGVAKNMKSYDNMIAVNLGQEVEFVNTSGWLVKRYESTQEIKDIILGNGLAGIIYKDRVEIVNL